MNLARHRMVRRVSQEWLTCSLVLVLFTASLGATTSSNEIARAVQQLGAGDFPTREKATQLLWSAGRAAEPALIDASKSADPEVAERARELLDKIRYGIQPDTPAALQELVRRYHAGDIEAKREVVNRLFAEGQPGAPVLLAIIEAEKNVDVRQQVFYEMFERLLESLEKLVGEGNFKLLDARFLLLSALDDEEGVRRLRIMQFDQAIRNHVAKLWFDGELEKRLPAVQAEVEKSPSNSAARLLAYGYRILGDAANARRAAERSGDARFVDEVLHEFEAWKELSARRLKSGEESHDLEELGLTAGYHRLAGNTQAFERVVQRILDLHAKGTNTPFAHELMSANERPREAITMLVREKNHAEAMAILRFQRRYRETFELGEQAKKEQGYAAFAADLQAAVAWHELGEPDRAQEILRPLTKAGLLTTNLVAVTQLVQAQAECSLNDDAIETCAQWMNEQDEAQVRPFVHALLRRKPARPEFTWRFYPNNEPGEEAQSWWKMLRHVHPGDDRKTALRKLQELYDRKWPDEKVTAFVQTARRMAVDAPAEWQVALGQLCVHAGLEDLALSLFEQSGPQGGMGAGDILAKRKRWAEAAERYGSAVRPEGDVPRPLAVFLQGWALEQAGEPARGKELMKQAHAVSLANEEPRLLLADALAQRGLLAAAGEEDELRWRTRWLISPYFEIPIDVVTNTAPPRRGYLGLAAFHERSILGAVLVLSYIAPTSQNIFLPYYVHWLRLRGHLQEGHLDRALAEADACLRLLPGDVNVPLELVPALDRGKRTKEADELFGRVAGFYEKLLAEFPRYAEGRHDFARLLAGCNRRAGEALAHAKKAVELEPRNEAFRELVGKLEAVKQAE